MLAPKSCHVTYDQELRPDHLHIGIVDLGEVLGMGIKTKDGCLIDGGSFTISSHRRLQRKLF